MPETLKREANPPSGQFAAPLPQAWDPSILDFRKLTGRLVEDNANPDLRRFAMDVIPWSQTAGGVWVPGQVNAQLSGRNVQPTVVTLRDTPLLAGQSVNLPLVDLTTPPGIARVGYIVVCDQPLTMSWVFGDGVSTPSIEDANVKARLTIYPQGEGEAQFVPPFVPMGRTMRVRLENRTTSDTTICRVYELRYTSGEFHPQNVRAVLAHQAAIRDTALHTPFRSEDRKWMWEVVRTAFGGGKLPIYLDNGCNQSATVEIVISISGVVAATLGTVTVPAASKMVVTNQDFPGLDVPSEVLQVRVQYSTAPTSGTFSAYVDLLVGADA